MPAYVALLRAVNVGGTGKLPMADLKAMCEAAGFFQVQTYIASGNVVFTSDLPEPAIKEALELRLATYAGQPVGVLVRSATELQAILAANPFQHHAANLTVAIFLDHPPPPTWRTAIKGHTNELFHAEGRDIFVHYPTGQGTSRLTIQAARQGTARNLNTITKLAALAAPQP